MTGRPGTPRRRPRPDPADPTRGLTRTTLGALAVLAALATGLGAVTQGAAGAGSGALGVGLVAILFGGGLLGLRRGRDADPLAAVAAAGALRLVLYASAVAVVSRAAWVHGPSLATATAASLACMLAVVIRAVSRGPATQLVTSMTTSTGS